MAAGGVVSLCIGVPTFNFILIFLGGLLFLFGVFLDMVG